MAVTERHTEVSPLVKHKAIVVCRNVLTRQYEKQFVFMLRNTSLPITGLNTTFL